MGRDSLNLSKERRQFEKQWNLFKIMAAKLNKGRKREQKAGIKSVLIFREIPSFKIALETQVRLKTATDSDHEAEQ